MGLEHENEQGHGHGPDCTCGCHNHEHEHALGQGHEHHHEHSEHFELSWGHVEFEAHTHEQAATISMDVHLHEGSSITFSSLIDTMRAIAKDAEQAGGIVGHIKAFAKQNDVFARASVTAANLSPTCDGDQSLMLGDKSEIQLVAIVLLIDQSTLFAISKNAFA